MCGGHIDARWNEVGLSADLHEAYQFHRDWTLKIHDLNGQLTNFWTNSTAAAKVVRIWMSPTHGQIDQHLNRRQVAEGELAVARIFTILTNESLGFV